MLSVRQVVIRLLELMTDGETICHVKIIRRDKEGSSIGCAYVPIFHVNAHDCICINEEDIKWQHADTPTPGHPNA